MSKISNAQGLAAIEEFKDITAAPFKGTRMNEAAKILTDLINERPDPTVVAQPEREPDPQPAETGPAPAPVTTPTDAPTA